ncbi:hypothetical protein N8I77_000881 [Diaporthe amygdali]|uniref:FAD-binding domain-containing protein n=1 Tax=Phomopsis amygdali TaxID=1214568 RepID=A0AAD9SPG7_PHOAM|nr:hypothetical protein N8I77_000881 [Diaporthe amygdali]
MANDTRLPVIVVGAGITGLLTCHALTKAGLKYRIFERDGFMNSRSNEWTMAIHWALPLLQKVLPDDIFAKVSDIACNPTVGIHSGLYPIIHGETGNLITGVPYENGLRVPRSKMRNLSAEGINVEYGKLLSNVIFPEDGGVIAHFADGTTVHGSMIIGADGPRSKLREIAVGNAEDAATTKFQIFHTNMTVCYNDADKALFVRKQYPTSYLALSEKSFHAFQSISSMPDGPDHPESWIFHMAMAWKGQVDDNLSYKERLALIKDKAKGLGDPTRSAFMWMPDDTEVHKADISYWIPHKWDNHQGRLTLIGDAAHPMPPYRGQGLNHCIRDVAYLLEAMQAWNHAGKALQDVIQNYEGEMVPRGQEEVTCSVENGYMLHDWDKVQQSPVFKRGFKPMDGHDTANNVGGAISA